MSDKKKSAWTIPLGLLVLGSIWASAGCSSDDSMSAMAADASVMADMGSPPGCVGANDCPPGYYCNTFGYCAVRSSSVDGGAPDIGPPPEVELKIEPPATGKRYVYVAVPDENMVARIDSDTLGVKTITVGDDPGALRTAPGEDLAVVLNRRGASASLMRAREDGGDDVITLPTARGLNQLVVAPDGKHAVAFFDVTRSGGVISGQTFQEVTLLKLEAGKEQAIDLSVGFRPSEVQFSGDSSQAFVITEKSISILELAAITEPTLLPSVQLLKDPLTEPPPTEVRVAEDGARAFVRLPGMQLLRVVDMDTGTITDLSLPGEPTDIDLSGDGQLVLAMLRDTMQVAFIDVPADITDPSGIELLATPQGYLAGQAVLTADGAHALLFTNAENQEVLLLADLTTRQLEVFPLEKGVRGVVAAPDGKTALILHNKVAGESVVTDPFELYVDKRHGYSLLDLASGFVKLQLTDADPGPVAFAPDGGAAHLLLDDRQASVRAVESIDLRSFLVRSVTLGSPPVAVGVVPSTSQTYVAQSHPLGRVTFIDDDGNKRTVTGFALNSQIIE